MSTDNYSMKGQWIGSCTGTNTGTVFVNVDELSSYFQGVAYLLDDNKLIPGSAIFFSTQNKNNDFHFQTNIVRPIDPKTGLVSLWENIKGYYSADVRMPNYIDVTGSWGKEVLNLSWTSDIGTSGKCILPRSNADKPSELIASDRDWDAYKKYVATLESRKFLFRGQNKQWRLRTSFHRTGRANLNKFLDEDIKVLYKHLSARTKHVFNLQIPDENGAFFNLVQHHGYPTPLLDWTYSPYVAIFFAYRGISNEMAAKAAPNEKVRIHVFDQAQWKNDWSQLHLLTATAPNFTVEEFMAVENERMIPQQSASTLTNLDDIESYIKTKESDGKKYLWAIDLPVRDRKKVIQELSYMGITAGSLFPGLDGACEELRERNFDI